MQAVTVKQKKSDIAYRLAVLLLLVSLFAINIFMGNKFVSQSDYKLDKLATTTSQIQNEKAINAINQVLTKMIEENKVNVRQDDMLKDHEGRLRVLESRRP